MIRASRIALAGVLAGAAAVVALCMCPAPPSQGPGRLAIEGAAHALPGAAVVVGPSRQPSVTSFPGTVQFEAWLKTTSSLRGIDLDGDWGHLDGAGKLIPSRSIRLRFDQLLTLQGEASLEAISSYVDASSRRALGDDGGHQLLDVWNRYLTLLRKSNATGLDLTDARNWSIVLSERHEARRAALGVNWATAFFEQDEAEFDAWNRQLLSQSPQPSHPSEIDPSTLTTEGRDRLQQEQAAWKDWESRLAQARTQWNSIRVQPGLSQEARRAEIEAWIGAHFDAAEQHRVHALLGPDLQRVDAPH